MPLAKVVVKIGLTPDVITMLSLLLIILAAYFYISHQLFFAALTTFLAGFCDVLDGAVARVSGSRSVFGGFFDSLVDRYSDFILITSITLSYPPLCNLTAGLVAMAGSLLTSYVRARGEALNLKMESVGFIERAERLIIIISASFLAMLDGRALDVAITLLAVLTHFTVIQRAFYVWRSLRCFKEP